MSSLAPRSRAGSPGSSRTAAITAMAHSGTLMKNIHRHDRCARISPPTVGPSTGASMAGTATALITRPIRAGPAARASMVCPIGRIIPAPKPCTSRNTMSEPMFQARPHSTDPVMNSSSETSHMVFGPNRTTAQPDSGMLADSARVYPVSTHCTAVSEVWNSDPSVFTATLVIVVSRMVMIAPSTTTITRLRRAGSNPAGAFVVCVICPVPHAHPATASHAADARSGVRGHSGTGRGSGRAGSRASCPARRTPRRRAPTADIR